MEVLGSQSVSVEGNLLLAKRLEWRFKAGYSTEDRLNRIGLKHYTASTSLGYKF